VQGSTLDRLGWVLEVSNAASHADASAGVEDERDGACDSAFAV
jgi:hypothetical protein